MLTLYVDLGSAHPCLSLIRDGRCIDVQPLIDHKDESALMPTTEALLAKHRYDWKHIDRIALMAGPGGFMSLRVGAAFVNAMSFVLAVPTAAIHASEVWAARVREGGVPRAEIPAPVVTEKEGKHSTIDGTKHSDDASEHSNNLSRHSACVLPSFLWLHSTKKTQLFICGFGSFTQMWPEPILIDLEILIALLRKKDATSFDSAQDDIAYVGELIPEHQSALSVMSIDHLKPLEDVLPKVLEKLGFERHQTLLPWYGREG